MINYIRNRVIILEGTPYNGLYGETPPPAPKRTITFSKQDEHHKPLFKELEILKLTDRATLHNALLMYHYYKYFLPSAFENVFKTVASVDSYNTRLASKSTYYINIIKTNYGKFNIHFAAVKVCSLTVHEFSTGIYLFIVLFFY